MRNFAYTSVMIHESMVAYYAVALARALSISPEKITIATLLHDHGKLHWNYNLFIKRKDELTKEDIFEILSHPKNSVDVVAKLLPERKQEYSKGDPSVFDLILFHHERPDGTGYYKIKDMPIESVLIAVADIFDACLSDRLYRKGLGLNDSLRESLKDYSTYFELKKYRLSKVKKTLVTSAVAVNLTAICPTAPATF